MVENHADAKKLTYPFLYTSSHIEQFQAFTSVIKTFKLLLNNQQQTSFFSAPTRRVPLRTKNRALL